MPILRRPRLASLAAPALALVIGAGLGAPAGATASDPIDEVRERVLGGVSAGSTTGGASSTTAERSPNARLGHLADPIDDVEAIDFDNNRRTMPARYARTIDINRFGYHFGERTAKFTVRTRDLRRVAGGYSNLWIEVLTRSKEEPDGAGFLIDVRGTSSTVETVNRWARPCPGRSVTRDEARNTITVRVPMRCLTGKGTPTSMQTGAAAFLDVGELSAWDYTGVTRRIDLRAGR